MADLRQLVGVVHRAQFGQQLVTVGDGATRRRFDERKILDHAQVQRLHAQDHPGQRRTQDFGVGKTRSTRKVFFVVQPNANAVSHPAAAASALIGRRLADGFDHELLDLAAQAVALDAGGAGIDHIANAGYGQRGFGHVGGQHNAPSGVAVKNTVLFGL